MFKGLRMSVLPDGSFWVVPLYFGNKGATLSRAKLGVQGMNLERAVGDVLVLVKARKDRAR